MFQLGGMWYISAEKHSADCMNLTILIPTATFLIPPMWSFRKHSLPWQHGYLTTNEAVSFSSGEKKANLNYCLMRSLLFFFIIFHQMKEYLPTYCQYSSRYISGKKNFFNFLSTLFLFWTRIQAVEAHRLTAS